MAALVAAIQPNRWRARSIGIADLRFILLDGRVKPGHMEKGHAGRGP
jgi:hypothetical protein